MYCSDFEQIRKSTGAQLFVSSAPGRSLENLKQQANRLITLAENFLISFLIFKTDLYIQREEELRQGAKSREVNWPSLAI